MVQSQNLINFYKTCARIEKAQNSNLYSSWVQVRTFIQFG